MRKLLAPVAALALVLATAGIALAWQPPTLTANCAPDEESFAWTINLQTDEPDYLIDLSWDNFATPLFDTIDFGGPGDHDFTTLRGGPILYVAWHGDPKAKSSLSGDEELCVPPQPGIGIVKSDDADAAVAPDTDVTYTYDVTNTGNTPLTHVVVKDQLLGSDNTACEVDSDVYTEDGVQNGILDPGETWTFSCTVALQVTTENEACVSADVSDVEGIADEQSEPVEACATDKVDVAEEDTEAGGGTPSGTLSDSSTALPAASPVPVIIFGMLLVTSLGSLAYANVKVAARRKR